MDERAVVIAGGGPTGLVLAGELALAGVDAVIVERRPSQALDGSRAGGLTARTIEVLDQRGIADRFLAEGTTMQMNWFVEVPLDISDFPSRHPYGLGLWQTHIERLLAEWVLDELGVPILRERSVVGFDADDDSVVVALSDGSTLRSSWLVGCDGGRSIVRKAAGIDFPGVDPSISFMIAEVSMTSEPPVGVRREGGGIGPAGDGSYRVVLKEPLGAAGEPTLADLQALLVATFDTDFGVHDPTWISRFTDATRQAATYRAGRVLLAGDAAHIHSPHGGQGLNLGVQDAANLGWKLARVAAGSSSASLLDTYHDERHPVGAEVLRLTMAMVAFSHGDERHEALRSVMADALAFDEPRRHLAGSLSGLGIRYHLGGDHPLVGRRMPDLDLPGGRVYDLLHDAQPVLLNFGTGWDTPYDGPWELPVIGAVEPPEAALVRPDGYVAWVGAPADAPSFDALWA